MAVLLRIFGQTEGKNSIELLDYGVHFSLDRLNTGMWCITDFQWTKRNRRVFARVSECMGMAEWESSRLDVKNKLVVFTVPVISPRSPYCYCAHLAITITVLLMPTIQHFNNCVRGSIDNESFEWRIWFPSVWMFDVQLIYLYILLVHGIRSVKIPISHRDFLIRRNANIHRNANK